jgi:hypothetical protein
MLSRRVTFAEQTRVISRECRSPLCRHPFRLSIRSSYKRPLMHRCEDGCMDRYRLPHDAQASMDCCVIAPMRSSAIRTGNLEILVGIEGGVS